MIVADIITEFGAYYLNSGQNLSRLYQLKRRDFVTQGIFTPVVTDDTLWRASKVTMQRIVQSFQKAFTPTGTPTFTPVEIKQFHMKADTSEYPDDLEATWLGFLSGDNVKRSEWPFVRWYLETQYFPQIQEDMEKSEIFSGSYVAPTANTPGNAGESMDGIKKVLAAHITAGRTSPQVLGAIPTSDEEFVEYLEAFHKDINPLYRNGTMMLCMSEDLELKYKRGYRAKYLKGTEKSEDSRTKIIDTNITIHALPSMVGSSRIFCTPKENAVLLKKKTQNQKAVDIQLVKREVAFMTDWWMGLGFVIPEIVFCNDQV